MIWTYKRVSFSGCVQKAEYFIILFLQVLFALLLGLFCLLDFLVGGIEETFGGVLQTFTVQYLGWSQGKGTLLIMIFWIAETAGRGLGIIQV